MFVSYILMPKTSFIINNISNKKCIITQVSVGFLIQRDIKQREN